ncbi:luciferin 4-monooxygenase-like [Drosophila kikkawai]|uniref:Luciferin 4-monooxygenase-like n=1 Tax=Drosophila kikkawai TaxID=30033 RepID=A0A6P4JDT1_DROKI|nr:luciferin 4-monooxygenase-like [Drosophila kikkawai]
MVKYWITDCILAPCRFSTLINCPEATPEALASLKSLNYGGGSISLATLQRTQERYKHVRIDTGYVMSESGPITFNLTNKNISSAGSPAPGTKVRIVNEDGKNLTFNEVGEILAYTGRPWKGYYGNPEETHRIQDAEGWFHTGDLGYFNEENNLYLVDRIREALKYQGLQYTPGEIEDVIMELLQVQDVCVVGVYNERAGDEAGALVVVNEGSFISEKEIVDHVAKRISAVQKQLRLGVQFTEKLPVNVNGKKIRIAAREEFLKKKAEAK